MKALNQYISIAKKILYVFPDKKTGKHLPNVVWKYTNVDLKTSLYVCVQLKQYPENLIS